MYNLLHINYNLKNAVKKKKMKIWDCHLYMGQAPST